MPLSGDRLRAALAFRAAGEAVLFALVVFSPWPFGSVEAIWQLVLSGGFLLLALLWAAHTFVTGEFSFRPDVVSASLAGLAVWTGLHLVPLPESVVQLVCPLRAEWNRTFLPAEMETLAGESPQSRESWVPLSVSPGPTRDYLGQILAVLIVYAVARNWLATRDGFRRLAWVATVNGAVLAIFAVSQSFLNPRDRIFGVVMEGTSCYGPFVCRNHYPDYVLLCVGLAVGLLVPARSPEELDDSDLGIVDRIWEAVLAPVRLVTSPQTLGLAIAIGLMVVSVPFSMSRGGTMGGIAAAVGAWFLARTGRRTATGRLAIGGVIGVAVLLGGWFGAGAVEKRLATVTTGEAFESRIPMWKDSLRLLPGSWLTGTGAGSFQWAEASVRTDGSSRVVFDSAHNEYLEALVDGGIVGLGLLLLAVFGALVVVGQGYRRRRERSVGPLLLGAWFGLAALALHSFGDFGIRIPSVALIAAVVAGYAIPAAEDPEFGRQRIRQRVRKRRSRSGDDAESRETPKSSEHPDPAKSGASLTGSSTENEEHPAWGTAQGWFAIVLALGVVVTAVVVAVDTRNRQLAERMRWYSDLVGQTGAELPAVRRAEYLAAAARLRPDDPTVLADAAQAEFDAASEVATVTTAAIAGPAAATLDDPALIPREVANRHVVAGLKYARQARSACPLNPKPHHFLGQYSGQFQKSEPSSVHFARAKKLITVDAYIWFRVGLEAFEQGDYPTAWENWHGSLARSTQYLVPIVADAGKKLSPVELIARVLPADPEVLVTTADTLYPQRDRSGDDRRPFLLAAVKAAEAPGATSSQLAAGASAAEQLDQTDVAVAFWRRAVALTPESEPIRDGFARFLERDERYSEAVQQLEWLSGRRYRDPSVRERLEAARHGAKLEKELAK